MVAAATRQLLALAIFLMFVGLWLFSSTFVAVGRAAVDTSLSPSCSAEPFKHGDFSEACTVRRMAATVPIDGEVILTLISTNMAPWGVNFADSLRVFGREKNLLLTALDSVECDRVQGFWQRHRGWAPACGWASAVIDHPGWGVWSIDPRDSPVAFFAVRWYVAARCADVDLNVLIMDLDGYVMHDVYALLHARPVSSFDVVITEISNKDGINCGFVYFNQRVAVGPRGDEEWEACADPAPEGPSCWPGARWLAHAIFERIMLFLELDRPLSNGRRPAANVMWEQTLINDVLHSAVRGLEVHPWAFAHTMGNANASDEWAAALGYRPPEGFIGRARNIGVLKRASRQQYDSPVGTTPFAEHDREHGAAYREGYMFNRSLQYMVLCPPVPFARKGSFRVFTHAERAKAPCFRTGRLLVAPRWLANQGEAPHLEWAVAQPPQHAYVHLVNAWRCWGTDACYSRISRVHWLKLNGLWDRRLDKEEPMDAPGVLALGPGSMARLHAADAMRYQDAHRLLHNLLTIAALLGRRALIPGLPCSFVNYSANILYPYKKTVYRFGLALHDITPIRREDGSLVCHPFPGGQYCDAKFAVHEYDRLRFLGGTSPDTLEVPPGDPATTLKALCARGAELHGNRLVLLEGLDPLDPRLVDAEAPRGRFITRPIDSILNDAPRTGTTTCPGMEHYRRARAKCPGYLLLNEETVSRSARLSGSASGL